MTTPRDLTAALMAVMDFTMDDLNNNRAGQLSDGQRQKLGVMGGRQVPFALLPFVGMGVLTLISGIAVLYLLTQSDFDFSTMIQDNPAAGTVVVVFIMVAISAGMSFRYYLSSRGLSSSTVRSVEGRIKVDAEGIGPNRQMWRSEPGFLMGAASIGGFFVWNVLRGRPLTTRKEHYMFHTGHRVTIGRREFHMLKAAGKVFEDGALYRLYYVKSYPVPVLISGEALDAPSPITDL